MSKSILIFGGGLNQLTLIQACNQQAYNSIVIDPMANPPGKEYASVFYQVAPNDYEETKRIAEFHKVDGLVTSQMQNPLKIMSRLAFELGLTFNTPEIIERCIDKFKMKKCFIENHIACAKGDQYQYYPGLIEELILDYNLPFIIKPKNSHSSMGVFKIESDQEFEKYVKETINYSSEGLFLVEEFIEGNELSIETVTQNGKTTIVQYTQKIITPYPFTVELGHIQPAQISNLEKEQIDSLIIRVIDALGIDNTVSHAEVKITENGPKIIEIGPRMGGDFISSYLTNASCGVDLDKVSVQLCVGDNVDLRPLRNKYSYVKYFTLNPGNKVIKINDYRDILEDPAVLFAHVFVKEGDVVERVKHSGNRSGVVIVEAEKQDELLEVAEKYCEKLRNKIEIQNHV